MWEIVWYGERGIINALVNDLKAQGIQAVQAFLGAICWADNGQREWIRQIQSVTFLVEIGLSQFGDPDLILVCRTAENQVYVVFIEAKLTPYFVAAMANDTGMAQRGYNSSINGQLSLKYRCARALEEWNAPHGVLTEPAALRNSYAQPTAVGGLADPSVAPRRLAQITVLRILNNQGLGHLPFSRFHFVAWTWDAKSYWNQQADATNMLPRFLGNLNAEVNAADLEQMHPADLWEQTQAQVGWIGYRSIEEALPNLLPGYLAARQRMLNANVPANEPAVGGLLHLMAVNLGEFEAPIIQLLANLEQAARKSFGAWAVRRLAGSSSVTFRGTVLIKLVPTDPGPNARIALGLSTSLSPAEWCGLEDLHLYQIGGQSFLVWQPNPEIGPQQYVNKATEVFEQIAERLGLNN